jgi:hypothetical protein
LGVSRWCPQDKNTLIWHKAAQQGVLRNNFGVSKFVHSRVALSFSQSTLPARVLTIKSPPRSPHPALPSAEGLRETPSWGASRSRSHRRLVSPTSQWWLEAASDRNRIAARLEPLPCLGVFLEQMIREAEREFLKGECCCCSRCSRSGDACRSAHQHHLQYHE